MGSPAVANFVVKEHASKHREQYPLAYNTVHHAMLVDDVVDSAETYEDARRVICQLIALHRLAGMELRKWASNSIMALRDLGDDQLATSVPLARVPVQIDEGHPVIKTLGLIWQTSSDTFHFEQSVLEPRPSWTRRKLLSAVARLFDPLGLLAPYVIVARMILQELTQIQHSEALDNKERWDLPLPGPSLKMWESWYEQLVELPQVTIPRCVRSFLSEQMALALHVFCDASAKAYGACAYVVSKAPGGEVQSSLLMSKSRVTPIQFVSISRLELQAAVLGVDMVARINSNLDQEFGMDQVHCWTDSSNVLCWLNNETRDLKTFVANRVAQIHHETRLANWKHVPSALNPADAITRGLAVKQLQEQTLWWRGPSFLVQDPDQWPRSFAIPTPDAFREF